RTQAVRLPVSTLTVEILSVERESFKAQQYSNGLFETSSYVAEARIEKVVRTDHGLNPGDSIQIRYDVRVRRPPLPANLNIRSLRSGETVTLTVSGSGRRFTWRP